MLKEKYAYSEPIFVEDLDQEQKDELVKLAKAGEIKMFEDGIYYFTKTVVFSTFESELPLRPESVIERRYLEHNGDVFGYISGFSLVNGAGLSRQVPNFLEITTNNVDNDGDFFVGIRRIKVHPSPIKITKENVNSLQFLDLMTWMDPVVFEEMDQFMLHEWIQENNIKLNDLYEYVDYFPEIAKQNLNREVVKNEFTQK